MPKFEFKAFDQSGNPKQGIVSANTKEQALKILQDQGLLVTYISQKKITFFSWAQKPNIKQIYIFTKQLSYLIKAKTPLDEAIKSLSETTSNNYLRQALIEIYNDLISGISFSNSLSKFPDIFNDYYIGLVRVGEFVGTLDDSLGYLASHLEAQIKFRSRVTQALIYPATVLVLFLAVIIALFYYVIPQISKIFIDNNIPMPFLTRFFNNISIFLSKFGLLLIIIFAFFVYYTYEYFKTREGRAVFFRLFGSVPIIGPLIKNIYAGQFLESFYYLLRGGVPIVEALEVVNKSIAHPLYESALEFVIEEVKKGKPLSEPLKRFPDLFPGIIVEGFVTAEKSGQVAEITYTILQFYNETIESQVGSIGEALQPIIIVVLGAGLGFLEASLLIPLLNLTKYIQTF
ncbi:MAG: type II secretion system F family protein [Patescibacteria group bacterium]|nr:type II secretion system F family protein [Patescibacteria group bacterium]